MAPRAAARLETLGFDPVHEYKAGKLDWMAVGDVHERVKADGWDAALVVDGARVVLGLLRSKELAKDPDQRIEQVMRPSPSTFRPYVSLHEMAHFMEEHDLESSPVTTSDGKLVGLLYRTDAVRLGMQPK